MKMFLLCLLGMTAVVLYYAKQPLQYYSEGLNDEIIVNAINRWDLNIKLIKVDKPEEANIIFKKTNSLSHLQRYGEANFSEIRVNKKYKLTEKELTNLLSHEFGHYLFLGHCTEPNSIMNTNVDLNDIYIRQEDKNKIWLLEFRLLVARALGVIQFYSSYSS